MKGSVSGRFTALLLAYAVLLMFVALLCQNITLANARDYWKALALALLLMAIADLLCLVAYRRSGWAKLPAGLIALPSLFIVLDTARRVLNVLAQ